MWQFIWPNSSHLSSTNLLIIITEMKGTPTMLTVETDSAQVSCDGLYGVLPAVEQITIDVALVDR